jgi:hypothetical protein
MRFTIHAASTESFRFLLTLVRYRGAPDHPHGERFTWQDDTTPRTDRPVRFYAAVSNPLALLPEPFRLEGRIYRRA